MAGFAFIAILAVVAFWVTNVACRPRSQSRSQPSYWFAVFGAFCAVLVMVLVIYNRALFTRQFWHDLWNDDRLPAVIFVPLFLCVSMGLALIPACFVVQHYRKKFKDDDHVA
jgi:hypothetical protein